MSLRSISLIRLLLLCPHCHALTIVPALLFRQANVNRLKAYRSNVVIFPRNAKKPRVRRKAVGSS